MSEISWLPYARIEGWSFKDWLNALEEHQEEPKYRQSWLQYRRKAYKQSRLDQSTLKAIIKQNNVDEIAYFFRKELLRLAQTKSFGRYQEPSGEDIDSSDEGSIDFVRELGPDALRQAPYLMRFLALLSRPAHNANKPVAIQDTSPKPSHLLIVSTLLYSIRKKTCNNVPKLTGIYFVNSGMKKRLVDMLSSFGICVSYSNIQETLKVLTNVGQKRLLVVSKDPTMNKAHDNFEFTEQPSGERLGHSKTFVSLTNGIIFKGARLPPDGLKQSSWHATILLLATGLLQKISKESKIKDVGKIL
ncbi:hypothetical protein N7G274_000652 [Stereocaulon virgatum]|uniref:Uncharacterized protein n=1 Tax=Stereocaulon virgatum TaxID=373712 RepID=A0ABR4AQU5_9LECA